MNHSRQNRTTPTKRSLLGLAVITALVLTPEAARGQETADYFKRHCASCHTVGGGDLVGPDLKNVGQRKDREWLTRFLLNPKGVIDGGDAYAQDLLKKYRDVLMPPSPDMSAQRAESVLDLLEAESKKPQSAFAGAGADMPTGAFSADDIEQGRQLFLGLKSFANGGAACLSCHAVQGGGTLGGGRLGPDLTGVFNKLQGRKGLAAWLSAPPTPTMQPIYKMHPFEPKETLQLVAFLESAREGQPETTVARFNFFLLGLAGTAGGFVLFDYLWRRRFRAVRRALTSGGEARGKV